MRKVSDPRRDHIQGPLWLTSAVEPSSGYHAPVPETVPRALYTTDDDRLVPTELTRGPWAADAQHGGPVAALIMRAVEGYESPVPVQVSRVTVDLLRPAPLEPLVVSSRLVRPGKRVQLIEATVSAGATEIARGLALRIRTAPIAVPAGAAGPPPEIGPEQVTAASRPPGQPMAFHLDGVEMRFLRGRFAEPGPGVVWMRLTVPVVAGEISSPMQRLAALADFGNGISALVPFDTHTFINPDLTVAVFRSPVDEWIGLDATTRLGSDGVGQATSILFDRVGPVGHAVQSLYLDQHETV
jgi:hypothetical protein